MLNRSNPAGQCLAIRSDRSPLPSATSRRRTNHRATLLATLALGLLGSGPASAAVISFAAPANVVFVNQPLTLTVSIDYEAGELGSLFSYGLAILPEPGIPGLTVNDLDVPDPLDFNAFAGPGAMKTILEGLIGVKGTVDLSVDPVMAYIGTILATTELEFSTPGSYTFDLDLYNTLGPTEDIFVDGNGNVLDDDITFGSTTITVVVPEPRLTLLLGACMACAVLRRRRAAPAGLAPG